jgi:hypothetical protein
VQLAAIERDAAGKALGADVKAKNLDASSVDIPRIVKARCRRCAPLSVRGCPIGPPEWPARESTRVPLSAQWGTPQPARALLSALTGVLHGVVDCSKLLRVTLLNSLPGVSLTPFFPW